MAYVPLATQFSTTYTLTSADGLSVAVFNDPSSANYVGMLTEVTGLDSAEVRENAQELVEADGGAHGHFYFGRRPVVLSGRVYGHGTLAVRAQRLDRARRASLSLRGDSILRWTPDGAQEVFLPVRRQQPFRESGGWNKDFQIPLVSEYATIQSTELVTSTAGVALENKGNWPAYPLLDVTGVSASPTISAGGLTFRTTGLNIAAGEKVEFDMLNHTARFTAGARNGQSANRYINWATTQWPYLAGLGSTQTFAITGGGTLQVRYRHTWA